MVMSLLKQDKKIKQRQPYRRTIVVLYTLLGLKFDAGANQLLPSVTFSYNRSRQESADNIQKYVSVIINLAGRKTNQHDNLLTHKIGMVIVIKNNLLRLLWLKPPTLVRFHHFTLAFFYSLIYLFFCIYLNSKQIDKYLQAQSID